MTLTGKEALLAILEGKHWWRCVGGVWIRFNGFRLVYKDTEKFRPRLTIEEVCSCHWTRGEPVDQND